MITQSTNNGIKTFSFLVANSNYDPDACDEPQLKFKSLPCTQDDLNRFKKGFGNTIFNLEYSEDLVIARNQKFSKFR